MDEDGPWDNLWDNPSRFHPNFAVSVSRVSSALIGVLGVVGGAGVSRRSLLIAWRNPTPGDSRKRQAAQPHETASASEITEQRDPAGTSASNL